MSLCPAVASGDVELVRDLLARGADPNQLGSYKGQCAIEWAMAMVKKKNRWEDYDAVRNIFACVELCLDAGADPNVLWDERVCGTPLDEEDINRARRESSESECIFCFYRVF